MSLSCLQIGRYWVYILLYFSMLSCASSSLWREGNDYSHHRAANLQSYYEFKYKRRKITLWFIMYILGSTHIRLLRILAIVLILDGSIWFILIIKVDWSARFIFWLPIRADALRFPQRLWIVCERFTNVVDWAVRLDMGLSLLCSFWEAGFRHVNDSLESFSLFYVATLGLI